MDTLDRYRQLIQQILTEHARVPFSYGNLQSVTVFDRESEHYLVVVQGWEERRRIHDCTIHVDIIDGKVWVQQDGTEYGVAQELVDAGVPKDRIVLGFKSPELRKYTEFAAA